MIRDNTSRHRFELDVEGAIAFVTYRKTQDAITLIHAEVPAEMRGRGLGSTLARGVLDAIRADGSRLVVLCPFIADYMAKHPEYNDLLS